MQFMLNKVVKLWEATQVELHGRYTSEQVLELAKYTREAKLVRVVGVLVSTPLPCLAVTMLVDVLPLAEPSKGIDTNFMYVVRTYCSYLVMNFLSIQQFRTSVPALPYPINRVFPNTLMISALCVGVHYGLARTIGFPVPFSIVTVMPAWVVFIAAFMAIEWAKEVKKNPKSGKMVANVMKEWMCEVLLVLIYPPFFYIFTTLSETKQMGVIATDDQDCHAKHFRTHCCTSP